MKNLFANYGDYINVETAPFIVLGAVFITLIVMIRSSIKQGFKTGKPIGIAEAMDSLDQDLSDINLKYVHQDEVNIISVYFDYFPSMETISRIPVTYKGFEVQTKIYDELSSARIK